MSAIILNRASTLGAVKRAGLAVQRSSTLPILQNLLIEHDGRGTLTVTGTDLETEISAGAEIESGDEPFEITLPAQKLTQILAGMPQPDVRLTINATRCTLAAGSGRYQLGMLPASDFPRLYATGAGVAPASIATPELADLLARTSYACARNDVRYYLNGVHLACRNGALTATATDGHQLARSSLPFSGSIGADEALISISTIETLRKLLTGDAVELSVIDRRMVTMRAGDTQLTAKLIDGRYPDADRVIPRSVKHTCTTDRAALESSVKRCIVLANDQYRAIRLDFSPGQIELATHNQDNEEATDKLDASYTGEPLAVGFNAGYLLGTLAVIGSDQVCIGLTDSGGAARLSAPGRDDGVHVLMPMRM